jgi:hypothetical protein
MLPDCLAAGGVRSCKNMDDDLSVPEVFFSMLYFFLFIEWIFCLS